MAPGRLRVEIIRFALLLTMTVALISVATRYNDHGSSREQAARSHHPSTGQTPSAGGSSGPSTASPTATGSPASPPSQSNNGQSSGSQSSSSQSSSGQSGGVATLPNTGNSTQTIELAALAVLFIAAGSLGVRISRPRPAGVQVTGSTTATAQSAQAVGSSESNRPGTS